MYILGRTSSAMAAEGNPDPECSDQEAELVSLRSQAEALQQELKTCKDELQKLQKQLSQSERLQKMTESYNEDLRQQVCSWRTGTVDGLRSILRLPELDQIKDNKRVNTRRLLITLCLCCFRLINWVQKSMSERRERGRKWMLRLRRRSIHGQRQVGILIFFC